MSYSFGMYTENERREMQIRATSESKLKVKLAEAKSWADEDRDSLRRYGRAEEKAREAERFDAEHPVFAKIFDTVLFLGPTLVFLGYSLYKNLDFIPPIRRFCYTAGDL